MRKVKKEVFDDAGFSIIEVDEEKPHRQEFEIDDAGVKPAKKAK